MCTAVVLGLDNFRVGMPGSLPFAGTAIDPTSYTLCANRSGHAVSPSLVLTVACGTPVSSQYVIIQSLDTADERLCLGEVKVYAYMTGQYAITFVL